MSAVGREPYVLWGHSGGACYCTSGCEGVFIAGDRLMNSTTALQIVGFMLAADVICEKNGFSFLQYGDSFSSSVNEAASWCYGLGSRPLYRVQDIRGHYSSLYFSILSPAPRVVSWGVRSFGGVCLVVFFLLRTRG